MPLLQSAGLGSSSDITIVADSLLPETGPSGSIADIDGSESDQISTYVVRDGDTLPAIAKMFDVSVNTIVWANDIKGGKITTGDTLVILPVSGVTYTVKEGDTLQTIAKKFNGDETEIIQFNDLPQDGTLTIGSDIIIPDGEIATPVPPKASSKTRGGFKADGSSGLVKGYSGPKFAGYYIHPLDSWHKTQGLHGFNAVDLGTPVGTPVHATAAGTVIISKTYGWNGGYGQYVAIKHSNGTETLYGHLSKNLVTVGQHVEQGQEIALTGLTGKTTGPHLHYEVRGGYNPEQDD
ncbi:MAG: peptidoglycan DD-metalloendopeptidase family protein [Candidatus Pacebacteria bacterium]|nr:peptidoglycan DD-metalloendopeptidase family protein [Candidatus Paceibacterota bacterium]